TAQLIDATTRSHISSDRLEGELKDIFDLQDQVAASVAGAIAPKLEQTEIERAKRKPTENLDAYDYLLRALSHVYKWTRESNEEALRLLRKAIELDSNFAAAYGQATWCYGFRKVNGWFTDPQQEIAEARRLARLAVENGKDDAFALSWAGFSLAQLSGELDDGKVFLDRAVALDPNLARAWHLRGLVQIWLGEPEVALEGLARAMRLSPLDPLLHRMQFATALAHFHAGQYDQASAWAERALREEPSNVDAMGVLAMSCALAGHMEKAQRAMARHRVMGPERRLSNLKERIPQFRRPEYYDRLLEGLRKAGM